MRYETPADLAAEAEIAAFAVGTTGTANKMPVHYVLDHFVVGRLGKGFFEVKDRNWQFGDGDGLYLSLFKVMAADQLRTFTGLSCFLLVRFRDRTIRWCSLDGWDKEHGVFWFGRNDRDEDEPCVRFPWSAFKEVKTP